MELQFRKGSFSIEDWYIPTDGKKILKWISKERRLCSKRGCGKVLPILVLTSG